MMNLQYKLASREKGFTLVETLVAISVLMIAIVGPYYIVQQSINASYAARDQLIAASLAQEAAEYVYFIRDNNFLTQSPVWLTGLDSCRVDMGHSNGCMVDPYPANGIVNCDGGCMPLQLDPNNLQYRQNAGFPATRFTRAIKITYNPAYPNQAKVVVTVNWTTAQHNYVITVNEVLYNWL